jgi:uncharacterized membrane protein YfcA
MLAFAALRLAVSKSLRVPGLAPLASGSTVLIASSTSSSGSLAAPATVRSLVAHAAMSSRAGLSALARRWQPGMLPHGPPSAPAQSAALAAGRRLVASSSGGQPAAEQLAAAVRKARWLSAPVGALAGLFGSVVGVGGGVVIVPVIVNACRTIPQRQAGKPPWRGSASKHVLGGKELTACNEQM